MEAIWILFQALMKTECTYKTIQVTLYIAPLSVMSVNYNVSQVLWVSTKISLINICLTIYGAPIWMPFGLVHKEHCITLLACFLQKLQHSKIWDFKCFQHHQAPFQLIIMGDCEQLLVYWPGQIAQVNMRPNKKIHPPARLGRYMQIFAWLVLIVEQHHRSFGVTKGYKLWLFPPLNPSSLSVSWLSLYQGLMNAEIRMWQFPFR